MYKYQRGKTRTSSLSGKENNIINSKDKNDVGSKIQNFFQISNDKELQRNTSSQLKLFNNSKVNDLFTINKTCRICFEKGDKMNPLIAPCLCEGSIKYVHQICLKKWLIKSKIRPELSRCEICKYKYYIRYFKDKKFDKQASKRFNFLVICLIIIMMIILTLFVISIYHTTFDNSKIKKKIKILFIIISICVAIILLSTTIVIFICCFKKKCSEKLFENYEIKDKFNDYSINSKTFSKQCGLSSIKTAQINNYVGVDLKK